MIFALICLLAGALAIKAADNSYSRVVCNYLQIHGSPDACTREISVRKSEYCSGDESFFTSEEIKKYIDSSKMNIDAMKSELEVTKKTATQMMEEAKKMCLGNSDCTKMFNVIIDLIEIPLDSAFDGFLASYTMANTFNLGAVCLAKNPGESFKNGLPMVTDSIVKRMEELCNSTNSMMFSYFYKLADVFGKLDGSLKAEMKEMIKVMEDMFKDDKVCHEMAMSIPFVEATGLTTMLTQGFDAAFSDMSNMTDYINCIMQNTMNPEICENVFDSTAFSDFIEGRLSLLTALANKQDTMEVDNKAGYDVYKASKSNPEYKEMTKEMPSALKGGLEAWAIAVIVIAVLLVLAGVGVAVFFLVIKPKRGKDISVN